MSGRLRAMRIIAIVMSVGGIGFALFTAIFGIVSPDQAPHAFHNLIVAALLVVITVPPLIEVARHPDAATGPLVVLSVVGLAALVTMALSLTIDPFTFPVVVLIGVLWALSPTRRVRLAQGRPSALLAALSVLTLILLAPYVLDQAALQRTDRTSEHAAFFHWVETSFYAAAIPLLGALAALRPRADRLAGRIAGTGLLVLGVGSVLLSGFASALPGLQAWACVAVGTALVAGTELAARRPAD